MEILAKKGCQIAVLCSCIIALISSCATYKTKTAAVETNVFNGDFKTAINSIDHNPFLLKDRNKLLYLMEKAKVAHLNGNYEQSNAIFEEAYILIDDKIKTSVGQTIAGKLTNPMAEPYKGEDFEKVTIHYYKAINYFKMGKPNEALVEAKRINIKLNALNDKYKNNKNKYGADAFSQILLGIIYESVGDLNNAFIAYRNASELYMKNDNKYFGVSMPDQLKQDLLRTSAQLGFKDELQAYQKQFGVLTVLPLSSSKQKSIGANPVKNDTATARPIGEAIVFWENGLGPVKDQIKITASGVSGAFVGTYGDTSDPDENIIIPIPAGINIGINALAIPKYTKRDSFYKKASIMVNGKECFLELSQDFYPIAKQCLKDRMQREVIDMAVRFGAKKATGKGLSFLATQFLGNDAGQITSLATDITNVATEKADTRNWQTLPATISYVRIPLKQGNNDFIIKKYSNVSVDESMLSIAGKPGLQIINCFDLGKTAMSSTRLK